MKKGGRIGHVPPPTLVPDRGHFGVEGAWPRTSEQPVRRVGRGFALVAVLGYQVTFRLRPRWRGVTDRFGLSYVRDALVRCDEGRLAIWEGIHVPRERTDRRDRPSEGMGL